MSQKIHRLPLGVLSSSAVRAFALVLLLGLALAGGTLLGQARAAGQGHGQGQGHGASQGGKLGGGLGGAVEGAAGAVGGAVGGALGGSVAGALNGAVKSAASAQSSAGGGLGGSPSSTGASALADKGATSQLSGTGDPANAEAAAGVGPSVGEGNLLDPAVLACSIASGPCEDELFVDLASVAPAGSISASQEALHKSRPPDRSAVGAMAWTSKPEVGAYDIGGWQQVTTKYNPTLLNSEGQGLSSDILASYSTAELANPTHGPNGLEGGPPQPVEAAGAVEWKAQMRTTVTGSLASADPIPADSAATSSEAAAQADSALVGGYKLWLGNFQSEGDARRYWARQVRRFPDLLKTLKPVLRRIQFATMGSLSYRLLGVSLASRDKAVHVCGTIQSRSPLAVCRVVLN